MRNSGKEAEGTITISEGYPSLSDNTTEHPKRTYVAAVSQWIVGIQDVLLLQYGIRFSSFIYIQASAFREKGGQCRPWTGSLAYVIIRGIISVGHTGRQGEKKEATT